MRTSHRQIRKRILDAKSKISDEEFFSSRAYNGYLTDLAEAATKRYKRPLRVRVVADHDDDTVAFTDCLQPHHLELTDPTAALHESGGLQCA